MKNIYKSKRLVLVAIAYLVVFFVAGCRKPTPEHVAMQTKLLYEAIENDNLEQAKKCIKAGANVNARTNSGHSALESAKKKKHLYVANLLKANGARPVSRMLLFVRRV